MTIWLKLSYTRKLPFETERTWIRQKGSKNMTTITEVYYLWVGLAQYRLQRGIIINEVYARNANDFSGFSLLFISAQINIDIICVCSFRYMKKQNQNIYQMLRCISVIFFIHHKYSPRYVQHQSFGLRKISCKIKTRFSAMHVNGDSVKWAFLIARRVKSGARSMYVKSIFTLIGSTGTVVFQIGHSHRNNAGWMNAQAADIVRVGA